MVLLTFSVRLKKWHIWYVGLMLYTAVCFNFVVCAGLVVIRVQFGSVSDAPYSVSSSWSDDVRGTELERGFLK
jgi:hypothetical protein